MLRVDRMTAFEVNYGGRVKAMTAAAIAVLSIVFAVGALRYHEHGAADALPMMVLPIVLLVSTALFTVLRYELDGGVLYVVRPVGRKAIARAVSAVATDDGGLKGAIRTFGNGGLFSFNGRFWVPRLGRCRVWVTDTGPLVVIHGDLGCVVVSPARRDAFVAAVVERFGVKP